MEMFLKILTEENSKLGYETLNSSFSTMLDYKFLILFADWK